MSAALPLAASVGGSGPPLVILHGLFGQKSNWGGLSKRLAERFTVHAVDLRNHGASPWHEVMDYPAMAGDVLAYLDANGLDAAHLLGHSMGGKAAMAAALTAPERVTRLLVADIAPVAYRHDLGDYITALRALDLGALTSKSQADQALSATIPEKPIRDFLLLNLARGDDGFAWKLNLAALDDAMPAITGWPEIWHGRRYTGPTLFLSGGRSDYVRATHHTTIRELFPQARLASLAEAGHWLHAERPQEFLRAMLEFFADDGG